MGANGRAPRVVTLHKSNVPFQRGLAADLDLESKKSQKLIRETKSILNKLTPEKEDQLKRQFTSDLNPDSYRRLEQLVATLFTHAIEDGRFSEVYARLSSFVNETWTEEDKHSFGLNQITKRYEPMKRADSTSGFKSFREVLLNRAQREFRKLRMLQLKDKSQFEDGSVEWKLLDVEEMLHSLPQKDSPEDYPAFRSMASALLKEYQSLEKQIKLRSLGNVRFMAELYNTGLLSINIVTGSIRQLVMADSELELEALCRLLPTIGRKLEGEEMGKETLPIMFRKIEQIITSGRTVGNSPQVISARMICLLQDICDLKERGWKERPATASVGPKKLEILHKEHYLRVDMETLRIKKKFGKGRKK